MQQNELSRIEEPQVAVSAIASRTTVSRVGFGRRAVKSRRTTSILVAAYADLDPLLLHPTNREDHAAVEFNSRDRRR